MFSDETFSTITYDTLVRAGVACTSAFVPEGNGENDNRSQESNPPFAKGSRGIRIVPDIYFSTSAATPVCNPIQNDARFPLLTQLDLRTNSTYWSYREARKAPRRSRAAHPSSI